MPAQGPVTRSTARALAVRLTPSLFKRSHARETPPASGRRFRLRRLTTQRPAQGPLTRSRARAQASEAAATAAAITRALDAYNAQPPPEENSDVSVQEFLEIQLDKEAPSLTAERYGDLVSNYTSLYVSMLLFVVDCRKKLRLSDRTCATTFAIALRVFSRKNIEMTTATDFKKVCVGSLLLACANDEVQYTASCVQKVIHDSKMLTSKESKAMMWSVFKDIQFEFKPTVFHFLEAACRQCTPPEVTAPHAAGLFCDLVKKLMLLVHFGPSCMLRLPSQLCFGCALAARRMLNIQCEVTLAPAERFNMNELDVVCKEIIELSSTEVYPTFLIAKNMPVLQKQIQDKASELRTLLETGPASLA